MDEPALREKKWRSWNANNSLPWKHGYDSQEKYDRIRKRQEKVLGILFFNEVYLHKYRNTHTGREWENGRDTSMRCEFEFYSIKFIPLLFHVTYNIYYKLTRGKKIYFCVALHASVVAAAVFSSSSFFFYI